MATKSVFKKGYVPWNKGLKVDRKKYPKMGAFGKRTKEQRKRISKGHMGQTAWNKGKKIPQISGVNNPFYGKKHSEETKKKISMAKKGKFSKSYYRRMGMLGILKQQTMKESTSIEKKVYEELKKCGLLFETQRLINGKFLVDAYIPNLNLVIEADGDYWHSLDRVKKRDKSKNAYLEACGFGLLRLTETEINNGEFKNKLRRKIGFTC